MLPAAFAAAWMLAAVVSPVPRIAPDLDLARACLDDYDFACASDEAARVLDQRPDDTAVHAMIGGAGFFTVAQIAERESRFLPYGLSFARSPARAELLRLTWRTLRHNRRVEEELPTADLAAERAALLVDLAAFEPDDLEDLTRVRLTQLGLMVADKQAYAGGIGALLEPLEASEDPVVLYMLVRSMNAPADRPQRAVFLDRLLRGDPADPRYGAYLLFDALDREDRESALRALIDNGLPNVRDQGVTFYDDDAWMFLASAQLDRGLDYDTQEYLAGIPHIEGPRRNTTEIALRLLALDSLARHDYAWALRFLDEWDVRDEKPSRDLLELRARILSESGHPAAAADVLRASLKLGGGDYERWYLLAREMQRVGDVPEALRLYQFYLFELDSRASGASPFGPPAPPKRQISRHALVWGHFVQLQPGFFARSAVRQMIELLALTGAALLAAARLRRARAFLLPALLAAEIAFFAGLITLRLTSDGQPITAVNWLWLGTAVGRSFVLVGGGLYLSAHARLPRRTVAAWPWIAAGIIVAVGAGWWVGFAKSPLYILGDVPPFARVTELGLGPEGAGVGWALLVSTLRTEASARLVWPALVLTALAPFAKKRAGEKAGVLVYLRWTASILVAAALTSAGTAFAFPAAFAAAILLVVARIRWGALSPFLLHAAFVGGAFARSM